MVLAASCPPKVKDPVWASKSLWNSAPVWRGLRTTSIYYWNTRAITVRPKWLWWESSKPFKTYPMDTSATQAMLRLGFGRFTTQRNSSISTWCAKAIFNLFIQHGSCACRMGVACCPRATVKNQGSECLAQVHLPLRHWGHIPFTNFSSLKWGPADL